MFNTIGFIGTGTMGAAVARAVVKGAPGASILLSNRTPAKAEALAKGLGVQASDNETVARTCSLIFLGVKPQMMAGMLESIAPILAARSDRFVLASMAAGLDERDSPATTTLPPRDDRDTAGWRCQESGSRPAPSR